MFYEARVHKTHPVASILEAATLIKEKNVAGYMAITCPLEDGQEIIFVNDAHIEDCSFAEVAVILRKDNELKQIESITAAWIDTPLELADYFQKSLSNPYPMGTTTLNIDKPAPNATAFFTCGCCGNGFKGNVAEQLKFDQDAGYGYCPPCVKRYHS